MFVDGDSRRGLLTLRSSPWRGIVATRSELNLNSLWKKSRGIRTAMHPG